MLELKITAHVHGKAESNIRGLKEEIAGKLESIADILFIDVKASAPLQLTLTDKPKVRQTVTKQTALDALAKANLTVEEHKNIIAAIIELNKTEGPEINDIRRFYNLEG